MYEHAHKAPFDLIQLLEKRYWDSSLEECLTATSIHPCFYPFLPFHPYPHPTAHSRTQVLSKQKANPEAKPAFNLGLIVEASNL